MSFSPIYCSFDSWLSYSTLRQPSYNIALTQNVFPIIFTLAAILNQINFDCLFVCFVDNMNPADFCVHPFLKIFD